MLLRAANQGVFRMLLRAANQRGFQDRNATLANLGQQRLLAPYLRVSLACCVFSRMALAAMFHGLDSEALRRGPGQVPGNFEQVRVSLPRIHMLIGQRSADTEFVRSRPLCSADEQKENAQSRLRGGSCTGIGKY